MTANNAVRISQRATRVIAADPLGIREVADVDHAHPLPLIDIVESDGAIAARREQDPVGEEQDLVDHVRFLEPGQSLRSCEVPETNAAREVGGRGDLSTR